MAQGFEDHNSSLQLVKFDPASNAPEHDHAVTAPEVFELPNAPEVGLHFRNRLVFRPANSQ